MSHTSSMLAMLCVAARPRSGVPWLIAVVAAAGIIGAQLSFLLRDSAIAERAQAMREKQAHGGMYIDDWVLYIQVPNRSSLIRLGQPQDMVLRGIRSTGTASAISRSVSPCGLFDRRTVRLDNGHPVVFAFSGGKLDGVGCEHSSSQARFGLTLRRIGRFAQAPPRWDNDGKVAKWRKSSGPEMVVLDVLETREDGGMAWGLALVRSQEAWEAVRGALRETDRSAILRPRRPVANEGDPRERGHTYALDFWKSEAQVDGHENANR